MLKTKTKWEQKSIPSFIMTFQFRKRQSHSQSHTPTKNSLLTLGVNTDEGNYSLCESNKIRANKLRKKVKLDHYAVN